MSAHLSAEFLANQLESVAFGRIDREHIGDESRIQLDGKSRRQINSEMIVRDQQNAPRRQNVDQRLTN